MLPDLRSEQAIDILTGALSHAQDAAQGEVSLHDTIARIQVVVKRQIYMQVGIDQLIYYQEMIQQKQQEAIAELSKPERSVPAAAPNPQAADNGLRPTGNAGASPACGVEEGNAEADMTGTAKLKHSAECRFA